MPSNSRPPDCGRAARLRYALCGQGLREDVAHAVKAIGGKVGSDKNALLHSFTGLHADQHRRPVGREEQQLPGKAISRAFTPSAA